MKTEHYLKRSKIKVQLDFDLKTQILNIKLNDSEYPVFIGLRLISNHGFNAQYVDDISIIIRSINLYVEEQEIFSIIYKLIYEELRKCDALVLRFPNSTLIKFYDDVNTSEKIREFIKNDFKYRKYLYKSDVFKLEMLADISLYKIYQDSLFEAWMTGDLKNLADNQIQGLFQFLKIEKFKQSHFIKKLIKRISSSLKNLKNLSENANLNKNKIRALKFKMNSLLKIYNYFIKNNLKEILRETYSCFQNYWYSEELEEILLADVKISIKSKTKIKKDS